MSIVGVSITKRTAFRDAAQEFSNTYHYNSGGANPSMSEAEKIIDHLVVLEKRIHATSVSFVRARLWSAGGTQEQNRMIFQKTLSGTGSLAADSIVDRERAYLMQWPAGRDVRGRPVRLKKWYHTCAPIGLGAWPAGVLANTAGFSEANRTAAQDAVSSFAPLMVDLIPYALTSKTNREITGPVRCHKYLEHHQLGDQWRT